MVTVLKNYGTRYFQILFGLAAPLPTLGWYREDSLTNPLFITVFLQFRPKGHWDPHNEVGSLSLAERLERFEPGTFWF